MFLFLFITVRQPSRFAVVSEPEESDKNKKPKNRSVREFFGQDEYCYIMDAKNNGNIGRYLNVSLLYTCTVVVQVHEELLTKKNLKLIHIPQ
jgi:hypothetical protein